MGVLEPLAHKIRQHSGQQVAMRQNGQPTRNDSHFNPMILCRAAVQSEQPVKHDLYSKPLRFRWLTSGCTCQESNPDRKLITRHKRGAQPRRIPTSLHVATDLPKLRSNDVERIAHVMHKRVDKSYIQCILKHFLVVLRLMSH